MKRRLTAALALAALAVTGALAALSFAPAALAWGPGNLPPGWTVDHIIANGAATCPSAYRIWNDNRTVFSNPFCEDSPSYQSDFDGFVDSHYTAPPPPPSTTAQTTTAAATTTAAPTTTAPPADATTTAPAPPAGGAPAPIDTVTTTTTVTVTTLSPVEQTLSDRIDALAAQIAALTDRVSRIQKAGDAAWLAYQQSIANGDGPITAAGIARGTFLNAVYQLGDFAP